MFAKRKAKEFAIKTVELANRITDERIREATIKYYNKYNGYNQREKLVKDAQTNNIVDFKDFDTHKELYNCKNGTFNLDTGELQPHDPEDMLTQISNVEYIKGAKCERWEQFINEITEGDKQSLELLQMISGYGLSGLVNHECFFMLYGEKTRNGKGTFNSTIYRMHGDYAKTLQPEALTVKSFYGNTDTPNESIAALAGARYACVSEPGEGFVLNSDLIKTLTGGDPIRTRFLHQHGFEYFPQFKIVINTNYLPVITDSTVFDSDRLFLINFTKHYGDEERDTSLKNYFIKHQNISGIFNWCYEGYRKLDSIGKFNIPEKSKKLFNQYKHDSDTTQLFIDECLIKSEGTRTSLQKVYNRYKEWTKENGFSQCSKKTLKKRLQRKEFLIESYGNSDKVFDYETLENTIPF